MYKGHLISELMENAIKNDKALTQQKIADSMEMSLRSLNNYRLGLSYPSVEMAEKIAKYFKKDMNYFFDIEDWQSVEIKPTIASEETPVYTNEAKDKLMLRMEEQIAQLQNQVEEQSIMLNAFRTGAIKVVDTPLGNERDGKCG